MIILLLEKIINSKNPEAFGRIPCVLLPGKHLKLQVKLMCIYTFTKVSPGFCLKFVIPLGFYYFSSMKPFKAISIATS